MYRQRLIFLSTAILLGFGLLTLLFTTVKPAHAFAGEYALKFDGETDWVLLPRAVNVMGPDWVYTKTVSVWVKPDGPAPASGDAANSSFIVGDHPRWFGIYWGNLDGQDKIWVWNSGDSSEDRIGFTHTPGEWVHVTLVHAHDELHAYKNGVLVNTIPTQATAQVIIDGTGGITQTNGFRVRFGGSSATYATNVNFDGQIDQLSLWNVALTPSEIRQNMYRTLDGTEPNLSAYYQMSNGTGAIVTDDSGNGHHGELRDGGGNITPTGTLATWIASGSFAGARNGLQFDGSDDHVTLNANADTALGSGWATTKTAELWARPTGSAPTVSTAAAGDILFAGPDWGISQANLGSDDRLYVWNNDGSEQAIPIEYDSGQWVHIALTHDGTTLTAYRNGRIVDSIASSSTASDGDLFSGGLSSGQSFAGELDELRLWNNVRTASEIQANRLQTLAGNESGLAAYYRFDQYNAADQTILYDVTANNLHGTLTNINPTTAWVASTAFNTWIGSDSADWADGRNWSQFAAPTAAANVGVPNYPNSLGAILSDTAVVDNLYIAPNASLTLTQDAVLTIDEWLHVAGTLVNNGRIQQTKAVNGAADVHFLDYGGNYGGVTINANSIDLGDTLVSIRSNQECTTVPGETVLRCIDISPTDNSSRDATVTITFLPDELGLFDCNNVDLYRWDGTGWGNALELDDSYGIDGRICSGDLYSIRAKEVSDFSPFVLAVDGAPTAVSLLSFNHATVTLPFGLIALLLAITLLTGLALAARSQRPI